MLVKIGDIAFHVDRQDVSGSDQTVVFLHGFGGSGAVFEGICRNLNNSGISTVAIDLPGHGQTVSPSDPDLFKISTQTSNIIELMKALTLESPWLYGYSMGGRIALQVAVKHKFPLSGLLLESAQLGISDEDERKQRVRSDRELANRLRIEPESFFQLWNRLPLFKPGVEELSAEALKFEEIQASQNPEHLALCLENVSPGLVAAIDVQELDLLPYPVLVFTGINDSKYDTMWTSLTSMSSHVDRIRIPNAGHRIHLDQPKILSKELIHYIKSKP